MPNVVDLSNQQPGTPLPLSSRDKSLPPLPDEPRPRTMPPASATERPQTLFTYDTRQLPPGTRPPHDFLPPNVLDRDLRRHSVGVLSPRQNLMTQTAPPIPPLEPHQMMAGTYDEFGRSRKSTGALERTPSSSKRKSRFGLSSLLGKKQSVVIGPDAVPYDTNSLYPSVNGPASDSQDDYTATGTSVSTTSGNPANRYSVVGRKPLEELVSQDAEFVAYRYPSNDQRLDLQRS